VQNFAFIGLCALISVPELTACCRRSEHRTLHAINARTAAYTLALPGLTRAWIKFLDCTQQPDGTFTLDALPVEHCSDSFYKPVGAIAALFWSVIIPAKLFWTLRQSASDGDWSADEMESHAWVLLKYKPERWYFVRLPLRP
jgi:hypothetical protein